MSQLLASTVVRAGNGPIYFSHSKPKNNHYSMVKADFFQDILMKTYFSCKTKISNLFLISLLLKKEKCIWFLGQN